jgi:hypothetical protein
MDPPRIGKAILVRFAWMALNTKSPHFEQSYSGGSLRVQASGSISGRRS